ncbi:MAG: hypothetical protein HOD60_13275, partial [Candidatus Nitrosopelagicus sp.]|nr:hypothetical protein [Candidatus Nitrosopelagicus sp.]
IDQYIADNPDAKLAKTHSVIIKGKSRDVQVYKIPLNLLFYNIKNGRFAAEYLELKESLGRELNPTDSSDKIVIQRMLLDLDPKKTLDLENDIRKFGQRDPGICTYDGYVFNGNRRFSVLQNIVDTGDLHYNFLQVARLPQETNDQDLSLIETGIQFSKNIQLDYGPINTLLKFKECIDAGLSPVQLAKNIYGFQDEKEVLEKLEILKLIVIYLKFIGSENHFMKANGIVEHFIDLNNILKREKNNGATLNEIMSYQNIGFQLICDGIHHKELRKLKNIISEEKSKQQLLKALEHSKPEPFEKKVERKLKADDDAGLTPARIIFNQAADTINSIKDSSKPITNLERAFTNLDTIDEQNEFIKTKEFQSLLDRIETIVNKLKHE